MRATAAVQVAISSAKKAGAQNGVSSSNSVMITSPLLLYRSLLASKKLAPDPEQHRLALRLQELHEELVDYEPVGGRWEELVRDVNASRAWNPWAIKQPWKQGGVQRARKVWREYFLGGNQSIGAETQENVSVRDLVKHLTSIDEAMAVDAPRGLLIHGPVGSGKSMLVDMLLLNGYSLWASRSARWHYSQFMLHIIRTLSAVSSPPAPAKHLVQQESSHTLSLALSLLRQSPLLIIDEFQLPDRFTAKTLSSLLTIFFRLGGVLVATSNRLPDELAKATGTQYGAAKDEFAGFLKVLKARCEVWEVESKRDWRKADILEDEDGDLRVEQQKDDTNPINYVLVGENESISSEEIETRVLNQLQPALLGDSTAHGEVRHILWEESRISIYSRLVKIPKSYNGVSLWTFSQLFTTRLGPADYISIASHYHTIIIIDIPTLTAPLKSEARRLITALDAFYEAGCKLFVTAAAPADSLFFPDEPTLKDAEGDAMHAETFSEIHQDSTVPFRPNIVSYDLSRDSGSQERARLRVRPDDMMEDDPPGRMRTDELSHLSSIEQIQLIDNLLDFKRTGSFVGEDELFAHKRAVSRLWEMCSTRWWEREGCWKPIDTAARHWESPPRPQNNTPSTIGFQGVLKEKPDIAPRFKAGDHAWSMVDRRNLKDG